MSEPCLLVERRGAVATLTLNRPDRINAFTPELLTAIAEALDAAEADPTVRAVLVTGAGRGFCSGQDIGQIATLPPEERDVSRILERFYEPVVRRMRASALPIVAAVNGVAAGAGANFALLADIVVAARSAQFVEAFVRIGLVPDVAGTWTLPRLVGDARARAMCLLGEPVGAEQAEAWGLIWKAVDDDRLAEEAFGVAERLAAQPAHALALVKKAFAASAGNDLDAQLQVERRLQTEAAASEDHAEGVRAFIGKRPPAWAPRRPQ
ncbi:enoyl-CoA hydratase-related protein [Methylopila henanensis]|uniref:Enoyl-CoA hydratase-related protein n=1 Tax=Methylopila henanensis TaxID=873516 RepID=A0ABW4K4Q9_9HYPH